MKNGGFNPRTDEMSDRIFRNSIARQKTSISATQDCASDYEAVSEDYVSDNV